MTSGLWPILTLGFLYGFAVGCVVTAILALYWWMGGARSADGD